MFFLRRFNDFYDYCFKMYLLDSEYLDKLMKIKPIDSKDSLKEYIQKANDYWDYKEERLISLGIITKEQIDDIHDELLHYES